MIIDYNLHLEKKNAIIANKFESKQIIKNISFLAKDKLIYYYHPSRKLENFLEKFKKYHYNKLIEENAIIIFDGINNFLHLSKIKEEIIKFFPDNTFLPYLIFKFSFCYILFSQCSCK